MTEDGAPSSGPSRAFAVEAGNKRWTAAQLGREAQRWAEALEAAGVGAREPVALQADNGLPLIVAMLAVRQAGASAVLLHPRLTGPETLALVRQAQARLLWTGRPPPEPPHVSEVATAPLPTAGSRPELRRLAARPRSLPAEYLVYSSGSEGRPKGVLLRETALRTHARLAGVRLDLQTGDRWLASLPFVHVGGLALLARARELGETLVVPTAPPPHDLDAPITAHRISHLSLVPTQVHRWLAARTNGPPPPSLRIVLVGGAAAAPELLARARRAGLPLRYTYGLTETASQVATAGPETPLGAVGPPLPGFEVRIVGEDGRPCPPGAEGEIRVRGPTLFEGYHEDPDATARAWADGWLRTGDRGRLDAEGNLWVLGRLGRRIHSGGVKVDPSEVEAVVELHPAVAESCVVGLPDPEWGEVVAAGVVLRPGAAASAPDLVEFCRGRLAPFKRPKQIRILAALPRGPLGKVQCAAVAQLLTAAAHEGARRTASA